MPAAVLGSQGSCPFSTRRSQLIALCLGCKPKLTDVQGDLGSDSCPETPLQQQCRHAPSDSSRHSPPLQVCPKSPSQAGESLAGPVSLIALPQPDRKLLGADVGWGLFRPPVSPEGPAWSGMWWACLTCPLVGHPQLFRWFTDSFRNLVEGLPWWCSG